MSRFALCNFLIRMEHGWAGCWHVYGLESSIIIEQDLCIRGRSSTLGSLALNGPPNSIPENIQFFGSSLRTCNM